ncbi:hypothetical protein ElyMa_000382600 [Elysia marginata]|uniref:Uncharacterized protein n=1 Tax=Elysia marginata TaxID=1093978 RepID=A0AAV4FHY0_9GAST|nr:hypothetical protein ElyMa_000382600 [Elysia marginata]
MRITRSHSVGPARAPPERAYLWVPRNGCTLGEASTQSGINVGAQEHGMGSILKRSETRKKGFSARMGGNGTRVGIEAERHGVEGRGSKCDGDGGLSTVTRNEVRGHSGTYGESVRRPITAAVKSARAVSSAARDSSSSHSLGASGHRSAVTTASHRRPNDNVLSSNTGQSVIYDTHDHRSLGSETEQQQQSQQGEQPTQHQQPTSSSYNLSYAHTNHLGSSYSLQDKAVTNPKDRSDSDRGRECVTSNVASNRINAKTNEEPVRNHSCLGFSSSSAVSVQPRFNKQGSVNFYSSRYNRGSQLFSSRFHKSSLQQKPQRSGFANFSSETSHRPQTARVESSHKPGAYVISKYRRSLDTRRPVTARPESSADHSFKNRLHQQERHRHQHPTSARLISFRQRSTSPRSSASSDSKPPPAPTPNLYRQLALATPGPPLSKNVQLNTGQQRPVSEIVRRDSGHQDVAAERREALSVQRSQSSLAVLTGGARSGTLTTNITRYDSSFNSARQGNIGSPGAKHSSSDKRGITSDSLAKTASSEARGTVAGEARITTRAPSSARIYLDSRRHNESSKILDLVGRQPGFLSTLALIPSNPAVDKNQITNFEQDHPDVNKSNTDNAQSAIGHQTIEHFSIRNQTVKSIDSRSPQAKHIEIEKIDTNEDTQWHRLNGDIYRNHWPNDESDPILGKISTPQSELQENAKSFTVYGDNIIKESNLKATDASSRNQLNNQNIITSDELRVRRFSGDRQRRVAAGVVTFDLPNDEDKSSSSVDSEEELEQQDDDSNQEQTTGSEDHCKMSAPELPPIAVAGVTSGKSGNSGTGKTPREHKRKTSNNSNYSSGSRASIHQMSNAVNSKTYYNRKTTNNSNNSSSHTGPGGGGGSGGGGGGTGSISTNTSTSSKRIKKKRLPMPRNHSDSSLKNLIAQQQQQQVASFAGSSCSSSMLPNGEGMMGVGDGGAGNSRQVKYLANGSRALSWCATENSGSQLKLETLFEGQNNNHGVDSDIAAPNGVLSNNNNNNNSGSAKGMSSIMNSSIYSGRILASPLSNHMPRTESNTSINNLLSNNNNGRTSTPPIMMNNNNSINNFRNMHNHSALSGHFVEGSGRKTASVKGGGGGGATDMPPILPPRSVSVNGIRSREDIARLVALNRFGEVSVEEGAEVMVDTVDDILARGHLRRSQSENRLHGRLANGGLLNQGAGDSSAVDGTPGKLQGGNNLRQASQGKSLSRNLSVDRLDRLTARPGHKRPSRVGSYSNVNNANNNNNGSYNKQMVSKTNNNASGGGGRLRKVNSMSAMPVNNNNNNNNSYNNNNNSNNVRNNNKPGYSRSKTGHANSSPTRYNNRTGSKRYTSHRDSVMDDYDNQEDDTPPEDDESIEASARLVEWLNVVNNIDEYDTDPQHTVVEYSDEPPQTDTAVHVVYEGH